MEAEIVPRLLKIEANFNWITYSDGEFFFFLVDAFIIEYFPVSIHVGPSSHQTSHHDGHHVESNVKQKIVRVDSVDFLVGNGEPEYKIYQSKKRNTWASVK